MKRFLSFLGIITFASTLLGVTSFDVYEKFINKTDPSTWTEEQVSEKVTQLDKDIAKSKQPGVFRRYKIDLETRWNREKARRTESARAAVLKDAKAAEAVVPQKDKQLLAKVAAVVAQPTLTPAALQQATEMVNQVAQEIDQLSTPDTAAKLAEVKTDLVTLTQTLPGAQQLQLVPSEPMPATSLPEPQRSALITDLWAHKTKLTPEAASTLSSLLKNKYHLSPAEIKWLKEYKPQPRQALLEGPAAHPEYPLQTGVMEITPAAPAPQPGRGTQLLLTAPPVSPAEPVMTDIQIDAQLKSLMDANDPADDEKTLKLLNLKLVKGGTPEEYHRRTLIELINKINALKEGERSKELEENLNDELAKLLEKDLKTNDLRNIYLLELKNKKTGGLTTDEYRRLAWLKGGRRTEVVPLGGLPQDPNLYGQPKAQPAAAKATAEAQAAAAKAVTPTAKPEIQTSAPAGTLSPGLGEMGGLNAPHSINQAPGAAGRSSMETTPTQKNAQIVPTGQKDPDLYTEQKSPSKQANRKAKPDEKKAAKKEAKQAKNTGDNAPIPPVQTKAPSSVEVNVGTGFVVNSAYLPSQGDPNLRGTPTSSQPQQTAETAKTAAQELAEAEELD